MNANEVEKGNDFFMGKNSNYFYGTKHPMKIYRVLQKESQVIISQNISKWNHQIINNKADCNKIIWKVFIICIMETTYFSLY